MPQPIFLFNPKFNHAAMKYGCDAAFHIHTHIDKKNSFVEVRLVVLVFDTQHYNLDCRRSEFSAIKIATPCRYCSCSKPNKHVIETSVAWKLSQDNHQVAINYSYL